MLPLDISKDRCGQLLERFAMLRVSPPRHGHGLPRRPCIRGVAVAQRGCAVERYAIMVPRCVSRPRVRPGFPLAGRVEELFVVAQPSVTPCSAMCVSSITP